VRKLIHALLSASQHGAAKRGSDRSIHRVRDVPKNDLPSRELMIEGKKINSV
jgi:hypothetical protein